ncbi:MAG: WxL domain-containing protein [Chloroflexota bacterium]|nr:WxL domain-containing protein [Chloroflexota bacterium]
MRLALRVWLAAAATSVAAAALVTNAAALSITTAAITFPDVTLDGSTVVVTGSTSAWRADGTGENGGWNITVASTDFSNGAGKTIAVSNFQVRLLDTNIVVVSGNTKPASTQTTFATLSGTALKIASAAVSEGNGVYDLTPDFRLTVPAETYAGNYTATVTIVISAGP